MLASSKMLAAFKIPDVKILAEYILTETKCVVAYKNFNLVHINRIPKC